MKNYKNYNFNVFYDFPASNRPCVSLLGCVFNPIANKTTSHISLFLKTVLPMVYYFEIDLSVVLKQNDNFSITLVHI